VSLRLHSAEYPSERLYQSVTRILGASGLCSLASEAEPGHPHIHTAFFAYSADLDLFFLSHPNARHSRNLALVPRVAIAVFDSHQVWGEAHAGLQLFGTAGPAHGAQLERARALYGARFPRYFEEAAGAPSGSSFSALQLYRFQPQRMQIFDEETFGDETLVTAQVHR
jgi:uncharacterized protein YhbP (UPF0306 family)